MSARWSTARVTAIASALAIGGSAMVATPAPAAPGDTAASAISMEFSLELGGANMLDVDAVAAAEQPGELVIPDLSAHLGPLTGAGVTGAATLTTGSGVEGSTSAAVISDLSVELLGTPAVSAEQVSASAECLPGALPAAETSAEGVTVLGSPVDLAAVPPEGLQLSTPATVTGMSSAEILAKVRPAGTTANASTAEATALTVNFTLKGTVPGVGRVASIWLGNIAVGDVGCEHRDLPAAPTAHELAPAEGVSTGGDSVTLKGSGFTADTTVDVGGTAAADVVVLSAGELTFSTPSGPAGPAMVTARTPSGTTNGLEFRYNEPAPQEPVVEEIDPDETAATGGEEIWIFGSGFVRGSTSVAVGNTVISPSDVEVLNSGALIVEAPAHAAGPAAVSVTTPVGTSGTVELNYLAVVAPPSITSITPDSGPLDGNTVVTLRGTGFVPAATTVTMDTSSFLDDDVTVVSDTELSFTVPAGTDGPVTIDVTTAAGTSNPVTYTYKAAPTPPTATTLSPTSGPAAGGTAVTMFGDGFVAGQTSVTVGGVQVPAGNVVVVSPTELTFNTPAHAAGSAAVTVSTPSGTSGVLSFSYLAAPPPPGGLEGHDFSGDGNVDVLARDGLGKLWLYPGNGAGGWKTRVLVGSGWNSMTSIVAPGDFSGDGKVDVLARDGLGKLWLYPGNGAGGWKTRVLVGSGWNSMTSIVAPGDFSGDGKVDVLARDGLGKLWLYPGNGAGGWKTRVLVGSGWNSMTSIVAPGDFSGDGKVDVLARDGLGKLWLYPGNGAGGWKTRVLVGSGWNSMTSIVAPGDFSGDGNVDVLARDRLGKLWLYPGNGAGGWKTRVLVGSGWNSMTNIV